MKNKAKLNFIIDFIGLVSFLVVAITGFWRWWFIPSGGVGKGVGLEIITLRQNVELWHNWSALVMTIMIIVHLLLHWNWILSVGKSFFIKK